MAVGGDVSGFRRPWVDEPRCESCHTGDANQHATDQLNGDGLRRYLAYSPTDPAATPRTAVNPRFADEPGKLFRYSKGHGGLACESCHGSTHAIWPTNDQKNPNDNVAAKQIQGHAGTLSECSTCHRPGSLPLTTAGPHGMHNVNDPKWVSGHDFFAEGNLAACTSCHGLDYRGTALSVAAAARSFSTEEGQIKIQKGQVVGCYTCHNGPNGG